MVNANESHLKVMRDVIMFFIKNDLTTPVRACNVLRLLSSADKSGIVCDKVALGDFLNGLPSRLSSVDLIEKVNDETYILSNAGREFLTGLFVIIDESEYLTKESVNDFFSAMLDCPINVLFSVLALSIFIDKRHCAWRNITKGFDYHIVHRIKFSAKTPLWYNEFVYYPENSTGKREVTKARLTNSGEKLTLSLLSKLIVK
jgi:hypothetical protein